MRAAAGKRGQPQNPPLSFQTVSVSDKFAKQISASEKRATHLGLSNEGIAFYDALATNNSAQEVMGDKKLRVIATELVTQVRNSVTVDWTQREGAQAKIASSSNASSADSTTHPTCRTPR